MMKSFSLKGVEVEKSEDSSFYVTMKGEELKITIRGDVTIILDLEVIRAEINKLIDDGE